MSEPLSSVVLFRLPKDAQVYGYARVTGNDRITGFPDIEPHRGAEQDTKSEDANDAVKAD